MVSLITLRQARKTSRPRLQNQFAWASTSLVVNNDVQDVDRITVGSCLEEEEYVSSLTLAMREPTAMECDGVEM